MTNYVLRRLLQIIPTIVVISIVTFLVIELPPGDYLDALRGQLAQSQLDQETIEGRLLLAQERFGLGEPVYIRYAKWFGGILTGDLGYSMYYNRPIADLIANRFLLTATLAIGTLLFTLAIGVSFGVLSAVYKYSLLDYAVQFVGFVGLAIPNFLFAIVVMFIIVTTFGGGGQIGLFSSEFILAPWSLAKFWDLLEHLWLPVLIIGTAGTAEMIRIVRAKMLDTLWEPFMLTARMKGTRERRAVLKHALRVAINPVVSGMGLAMPMIISGEVITSLVLQLPTLGPLLYSALLAQDMYLAATILFLMTILLVLGNLIADLVLAWLDPRIRYD